MSKIFSTTNPTLIRMIAENERQHGTAIKYGSLTGEEQESQAQGIQEVLEHFDLNISALDSIDEPNLYAARIANRYEKTLQEKDEQIRILARALQRIAALERSDPRRNKLAMARGIAKAAIKELS